ncbi:MAG: carboxypeptidase-like regulatory domain-containing protein, partial [Bacteroidales bacterium]|nr:carboxypeptidase-like regulatory domain-containing protein [Bacteroidales bacterium]
MLKYVLTFLLSLHFFLLSAQNEWIIKGIIADSAGNPIEYVNIKVLNSNNGTVSDNKGNYNLHIKSKKEIILQFSAINYASKEIAIPYLSHPIELNVFLESKDEELSEIQITDEKAREKGLTSIEPKLLDNIPNISGNQIQTFIKTLPGVASVNELSANYSVRGGSFDENLVYINDFEIFRPVLLQSGQQEGLNMVNSDLVSKVEFSSGGFSAKYADKMSSVLDITYKKPIEFKATTSLSLLGASAHIEGSHFNKKISHLTGLRYKNSQYLLSSLDTQGEYKPNFLDFQTLLSYNLYGNIKVSLLAYYANNNYLFYPEDRNTSFGTTNEALNLYIDFEGSEKDKFTSMMGGINIEYRPSENLNLKLTGAAYDNSESLTYDIKGRYSLNQLDKELGSSTFGDSILNLGIGSFIDHARSYFDANIYSLNHTGWWQTGRHFVQWGLKFQNEQVNDRINEWKMVDSAGFSIPYTNSEIKLAEYWNSQNNLNSNRYNSYIQANFKNDGQLLWNIEYGVRASWWDVNKELLISPRISISWYPYKIQKLYFRIGGGVYYQSVFYREIIDRQGIMHKNAKTPYSIQYTASIDYDFAMFKRPFHFKAEAYYKDLKKIIPYGVDNIRLIYYPDKQAKGYAGGLDLRVNGEFVKGTDSWLSLSIMKSGI